MGTTDAALAAVQQGAGIWLVGKGINDQGIYVNHYDQNSDAWSGWSTVEGGGKTDASIAVLGPSVYDGIYCLHLFVRGLDNRIYWNPTNHIPGF